ncbi:MAG TPA: hypothetical protein VFQ44_19120 [Streptosporangiaceae bacterium]|nr:hypothetical protein [Streptosporangiaceae bacterium]
MVSISGHDAGTVTALALARRKRTEVELARLDGEHGKWMARRWGAPEAGTYRSQLNAIDAVVRAGLDQLGAWLGEVDLSSPLGDVYEACRTFDLRLLWLRRVRDFFTEKFDQRDGELADVIHAADELVWSCYHLVLERARELAGIRAGTLPLPFIEPRYSPTTFPADLVPAGLRSEIDEPFLTEHLNRLPVPIVRLQPACVSGPWWLLYAAHEVGHSVQFDLAGKRALVDGYQQLVTQAVSDAGGEAGDAARWGTWSKEIFADIFSVLMMGPWAIWAMVELELQSEAAMGEHRELRPQGAAGHRPARNAAVAIAAVPELAAEAPFDLCLYASEA